MTQLQNGLYPHQVDGIKFLTQHGRAILAVLVKMRLRCVQEWPTMLPMRPARGNNQYHIGYSPWSCAAQCAAQSPLCLDN